MADMLITNLEQARSKCPAIFAEAPHEQVSEKYTFVPTYKIAEALERYGWQAEGVAYTRVRANFADKATTRAHGVRFGNPSLPAHRSARAQIVLRTAHDTSSAVQARLGLYTFACANQAVVGNTLGSFRIAHVQTSLEAVLDGISQLAALVPQVFGQLDAWQGRILTSEEIREYSAKAQLLRHSDGEGQPEVWSGFGSARRSEDEGASLYSVYQRTQESLLRGGYMVRDPMTNRYHKARAIRGVDANIKLNTGLWDLTSQYLLA